MPPKIVEMTKEATEMALTMKEKKAVTAEVAKRYQKARKKERKLILDEFVSLTGYSRCYGAFILRNWGRKVRLRTNGKEVVFVFGKDKKRQKRKRESFYDEDVISALKHIWVICDFICGKRLAPYLKEIVPVLERFGEIEIDDMVRRKLFLISAATIDRLLGPERKKYALKGRSTTKPGSLLKHQIPIRTFSDWDEAAPGFLEIDLVSHDGGNMIGDFIQTLDATDICTGWTETMAVKNKAQIWVFAALVKILERVPFRVIGIDSDNGSEFINAHLLRFCEQEAISFTRSRPYRKNDSCFVEQKNYSVVRRAVGYLRYDSDAELKALNELYGYLRLYTNFFQPVMKLTQKIRTGSKVKRCYDMAKTPYHRVLLLPSIPEDDKRRLEREYAKLNPADLKREITRLQEMLIELSTKNRLLSSNARKPKGFNCGISKKPVRHLEYIYR